MIVAISKCAFLHSVVGIALIRMDTRFTGRWSAIWVEREREGCLNAGHVFYRAIRLSISLFLLGAFTSEIAPADRTERNPKRNARNGFPAIMEPNSRNCCRNAVFSPLFTSKHSAYPFLSTRFVVRRGYSLNRTLSPRDSDHSMRDRHSRDAIPLKEWKSQAKHTDSE